MQQLNSIGKGAKSKGARGERPAGAKKSKKLLSVEAVEALLWEQTRWSNRLCDTAPWTLCVALCCDSGADCWDA